VIPSDTLDAVTLLLEFWGNRTSGCSRWGFLKSRPPARNLDNLRIGTARVIDKPMAMRWKAKRFSGLYVCILTEGAGSHVEWIIASDQHVKSI